MIIEFWGAHLAFFSASFIPLCRLYGRQTRKSFKKKAVFGDLAFVGRQWISATKNLEIAALAISVVYIIIIIIGSSTSKCDKITPSGKKKKEEKMIKSFSFCFSLRVFCVSSCIRANGKYICQGEEKWMSRKKTPYDPSSSNGGIPSMTPGQDPRAGPPGRTPEHDPQAWPGYVPDEREWLGS